MTLACFTSLPSFAQVSLPPITVHPGPGIEWMPMGPEQPPQTGGCNDFFGCGTGGGDQTGPGDDWNQPEPGECRNTRNKGNESSTCSKRDYCAIKDKLIAMISALPITGSAANMYGFGQVATGYAMNSITASYRDIEMYFANCTGDHFPYYGNLNAQIDWQHAAVDWCQYDAEWQNSPNSAFGDPNSRNGGAQMILANYFHSLGAGSGEYIVPTNLLPPDPDPSTSCD